MKKRVLITAATGNISTRVITFLNNRNHQIDLIAGVKDLETDPEKLSGYGLGFVKFDFSDPASYAPALKNCDTLFLIRPAQLPDAPVYFKQLIGIAKDVGVKHIVFLSVQGAENKKNASHGKIEKMIMNSRISYTFLRAAYFMQNFTGDLQHELVNNKRIFLPAGDTKFTLIDAGDISDVIARILADTSGYVNKTYELTSADNLNFKQMALCLSEGLGTDIHFTSPNLIQFIIVKKKEKMPFHDILKSILLHYAPRFQKELPITKWVEMITGRAPVSFVQFIATNKNLLSA